MSACITCKATLMGGSFRFRRRFAKVSCLYNIYGFHTCSDAVVRNELLPQIAQDLFCDAVCCDKFDANPGVLLPFTAFNIVASRRKYRCSPHGTLRKPPRRAGLGCDAGIIEHGLDLPQTASDAMIPGQGLSGCRGFALKQKSLLRLSGRQGRHAVSEPPSSSSLRPAQLPAVSGNADHASIDRQPRHYRDL